MDDLQQDSELSDIAEVEEEEFVDPRSPRLTSAQLAQKQVRVSNKITFVAIKL